MANDQFNRQWALGEFTSQHRQRLQSARVLVLGAGGLGHPVVAYLAGAGVHTISLLDQDVVQLSNLPRQIFFGVNDLGLPKVNSLADHINGLQGKPIVVPYREFLTADNADHWIDSHDVVVDCTDSLELKYLLSEKCQKLQKPWAMGAVDQWQGQILAIPNADSPNYAHYFPRAANQGDWGSCASNGVVGTVVGVVATMLANETIKIILGLEEKRKNRIIIFDGRTAEFFYIRCDVTKTNLNFPTEQVFGLFHMKSISHAEMQQWRNEGKSFQLIDVREPFEFEEFNLGGDLIPMNTVPDHVEAFSREIPVVVHCKAGSRSANVIRFLEEQYGFTNLYNLDGGVLAAL